MIADLDLAAHGLHDRARAGSTTSCRCLTIATSLSGAGRTQTEVAKFSRRDAERLPEYERRLEAIADVLRALALEPPPNVTEGGWLKALPELLRAGRLGKRVQVARRHPAHATCSICSRNPPRDYLDRLFESEPIKALFGFDGVVGNYASPYTPGSAYVLLHHVFGEVNGVKGAWGHALGGMGAITQAMAKSAVAAGVEIRIGQAVREVLVEQGRAVGVVTDRGETLRARAVVANVNPKLLYERLLDPAAVPAPTRERMANWRCGSGTFRMNVALSRAAAISRHCRKRAII